MIITMNNNNIVFLFLFFFVAGALGLAPLLHSDNQNVIPGSYIIVLNDDIDIHQRDAHILELENEILNLSKDENKIGFKYNVDSFIGFSATLNKEMLKKQLLHPSVKYIEADQMMTIHSSHPLAPSQILVTQTGATWGLDRIDQRDLPLNNLYIYNQSAGSGVDVYLIDTGILTSHIDFGGRASSFFNAITSENDTDLNGHGTHCAGTIGGKVYGVAKEASIKSVKVLSASGSGSNSGVISGISFIINNKSPSRKSVACMTLGGGASTALDTVIINAIQSGTPFVLASGNDNSNACNYSPGRISQGITVAGSSSSDTSSPSSNYGTCVDLYAPGVLITSDWIGSNSAISTISGVAAPHVAGAAALFLGIDSSIDVKKQLLIIATPNKIIINGSPTGSLLFTDPDQ